MLLHADGDSVVVALSSRLVLLQLSRRPASSQSEQRFDVHTRGIVDFASLSSVAVEATPHDDAEMGGDSESLQYRATDDILAIAVSADTIAVADDKKRLHVVDARSAERLSSRTMAKRAFCLTFTPDAQQIIVGDKLGDVCSYSVESGSDVQGQFLLGHTCMILDVAFLRRGKNRFSLVTCDRDEKIRCSAWPNSFSIERFLLRHEEFVTSISVCNECSLLFSAGGDGRLCCWTEDNIDSEANDEPLAIDCNRGVGRKRIQLEDDSIVGPNVLGCAALHVDSDRHIVACFYQESSLVDVFHINGGGNADLLAELHTAATVRDIDFVMAGSVTTPFAMLLALTESESKPMSAFRIDKEPTLSVAEDSDASKSLCDALLPLIDEKCRRRVPEKTNLYAARLLELEPSADGVPRRTRVPAVKRQRVAIDSTISDAEIIV